MLFQWRVAQGHYPHSELWLNLWEREMVPVPALLTNLLCMFVFVSCDCVQTVDSNSQAFIAKVKKNWPWTGKTFWGGRFNEVFDMVSKQFMSGHTQIWGWQWCCVLRRATWNKKLSHSSRYFFFQMSHIHFYIFLILLTLHLWLLIPGLKKEASKTRQSSSLMTGPLRCLLSP